MIKDLRKATKNELLEEWHNTRKDLSKTLDTVTTVEKFNVLLHSYLLPTMRYLETLTKMIDKKEEGK